MSGIIGSKINIRGSGRIAKLGTDGQVLTSSGAGQQANYEDAGGGANTPAFAATFSGTTDTSADTWTKVALNTEVFDTDGDYDNSSNYRFTPTTAGKYYLYGHCWSYMKSTAAQSTSFKSALYKNGSEVDTTVTIVDTYGSADQQAGSVNVTTIQDANGSSDYFEFYIRIADEIAVMYRGEFGGYKIIE